MFVTKGHTPKSWQFLGCNVLIGSKITNLWGPFLYCNVLTDSNIANKLVARSIPTLINLLKVSKTKMTDHKAIPLLTTRKSHNSTQIQSYWNGTSPYDCTLNVLDWSSGLVHPNPVQNVKKLFFFSFGPLLLPKLITFSNPIQIERSKVLWEHHLKLYNSSFNSKGSRTTYKDCLGVFRTIS
jgi:hypothetical protein